jgi:hypothetical protein
VSTKRAIDCSTTLTAPSAAAIHKAALDGVLRYLGSWRKSLTTGEAAIIHGAGLNLGLIYEANPTSAAAFTTTQAKTDVSNAVASAKSHGAPAGVGIAFTVDYDAAVHDLDAIVAYFGVVIAGIGQYKPGAYGDDIVLDALYRTYGEKLFYWQTSGWSNGARFPHAALYQGTYDQTVGGVQCDIDEVLGYAYWWGPNHGGGNVTESTLQLIIPYITGTAVKALQQKLNAHGANPALTEDGVFGPMTENAVKVFQKSQGLAVDGIVGPLTWSALNKLVAHNYQLVIDQPPTGVCGQYVTIKIATMDNGEPLPNQTLDKVVSSAPGDGTGTALDAPTGPDGVYYAQIMETAPKVSTVTATWTDPDKKVHIVSGHTAFAAPVMTTPVLPSDCELVAAVPVTFARDAVLFTMQTLDGKDIPMQLDTGAFELMFDKSAADALGLKDPGGNADIQIQGVTGSSPAYMTTATFIIGGVTFTDVQCVVDPSAQGCLFGYRQFQDNHYDLMVSQKHNCFVIMR